MSTLRDLLKSRPKLGLKSDADEESLREMRSVDVGRQGGPDRGRRGGCRRRHDRGGRRLSLLQKRNDIFQLGLVRATSLESQHNLFAGNVRIVQNDDAGLCTADGGAPNRKRTD